MEPTIACMEDEVRTCGDLNFVQCIICLAHNLALQAGNIAKSSQALFAPVSMAQNMMDHVQTVKNQQRDLFILVAAEHPDLFRGFFANSPHLIEKFLGEKPPDAENILVA